MQQDFLEISNDTTTPWFKTKAFKIGVVVLAIVAVIAIVLFSTQIGELLELFGLKAAPEARSIILDGIDGIGEGHTFFFEPVWNVDPSGDSLGIIDNKLMFKSK